MSHFLVMVIGDDYEKQLSPYQENNMGDCPKEYLEFHDVEQEYREELKTETRSEFYCSSSCSWGQVVSDSAYDTIKALSVGGLDNIHVEGTMHYFQKGCKYRCYPASKGDEYPGEYHIWVEVVNIVESTHPDSDVCFNGIIQVKRIDPPKEVCLKDFYTQKYIEKHSGALIGDVDPEALFEYFIEEWAGYKKDPETEKYGYWENPNKKWDWYEVGGRWTGYFRLKSGSKADQCLKKDIDIEGMRKEAEDKAAEEYDKVQRIISGRQIKHRWKDLLEKEKTGKISIKEARKIYFNQEVIMDFNREFHFKSIEDFLIDRDGYLKKARDSALTPFALVKNGQWYEKGSMGWWGVVSDEKNGWNEKFQELFDELPCDTIITVVDCHI